MAMRERPNYDKIASYAKTLMGSVGLKSAAIRWDMGVNIRLTVGQSRPSSDLFSSPVSDSSASQKWNVCLCSRWGERPGHHRRYEVGDS